MADRSHVLPFPTWTIVLRGLQLALGITIMGLAAYGINYFPISGGYDGIDLTMYTAITTMITAVYILVATFAFPIAYNYWAILGLDIHGVLFWLISFALLASEVSTYKSDVVDVVNNCVWEFGVCYYKRAILKRDTTVSDYYHAMAATAALGAFEFVLFVITLVFTGLWLHRHRKAGGHCIPSNSPYNNSSVQRKPVATSDENTTSSYPMTNVANP